MPEYRQFPLPLPDFADMQSASVETTDEPMPASEPIPDRRELGWTQLVLPGFEMLMHGDDEMQRLEEPFVHLERIGQAEATSPYL